MCNTALQRAGRRDGAARDAIDDNVSVQRLPRLVATDLDGTLVRSDRTLSTYTIEVLRRLDERDVPVVFVTGRPLRWTEEVFAHVGSHGFAVVSNGALVWDVHTSTPRLERPLEVTLALEVADALRSAIPGSAFGVETTHGFGIEPGYVQTFVADEPRRGPLDEVIDGPVLKLLAKHQELGPDAFARSATEVVGDRVTVTHSTGAALLEISAPGVTKASTLALICAELGIDPADVVAFGDMPNDLQMLGWAGTSYAMADAHPEVLACATHTAPGHDDDGVARVLSQLFDL